MISEKLENVNSGTSLPSATEDSCDLRELSMIGLEHLFVELWIERDLGKCDYRGRARAANDHAALERQLALAEAEIVRRVSARKEE